MQNTISKDTLRENVMRNENQEYPSLDTVFEIEHIYARSRYDLEKSLSSKDVVEMLGAFGRFLSEQRLIK